MKDHKPHQGESNKIEDAVHALSPGWKLIPSAVPLLLILRTR
jgi:hypothetical protein